MASPHLRVILVVLMLAVLSRIDSNTPVARALDGGCPGAAVSSSNVLLCDDFEDGKVLERWSVGSRGNSWPPAQIVLCGDAFGFNDRCAAWSNYLLFDGAWGFWGYDARTPVPLGSEFYVRWYQYISDPYTWGSLEDKSVMIHDSSNTITAYVASSRNHLPVVQDSGPGVPFVANYQDVDVLETGWQGTKVDRFQNQGNNITLQPGRWYLFEWYVRLNTPGQSDGVTRLWIDDATNPVGAQTLRLQYTDMRWLRSSDAGKRFEALRLTDYDQRCDGVPNTCPPNGPALLTQSNRWDEVVVAKVPIGPLVPPKVAVTWPLPSTILSGSTSLTAAPRSGSALAGVQFVVDGAPLGAEVTAAPFSLSWNSSAVADGKHVVGAVGRDTAGTLWPAKPVSVVVANRTVITRVEDGDTSIAFSPSNSWIQGNSMRAWSGGAAALGFAAGQRASINFNGTGVSWIGFRGPETGIANVFLDGSLVSTVDPYSPSEQVGAVLFTTNGLPMGSHTLRIEVPSPRAKNRSSSDYFTVADAFDVLGVSATSDVTASLGHIEETSAAVTYSGSWILGNTIRQWSGGTASLGFATGQRAMLNFVGTGVTWIGFKGPQAGTANVYLDGVLITTVDEYSPSEQVQTALWSVTGLASGLHVLTIEATGTKNPASSDRFVVVDAFDVS